MTRGHGSLFVATRSGVAVAGISVRVAGPPAPTWWAHHRGCAWTAASLTACGHSFLGPRELLEDSAWSGEISWRDRKGFNASTHRPDLIGAPGSKQVAIEVELAKKSSERLRAILGLHARWRAAGRTGGVIYICGDQDVRTRIANVAKEYGLPESPRSWLRIQALEMVRAQAVQACEVRRAERASAGGRPMLDSDGA
jgi:hypothetical protein